MASYTGGCHCGNVRYKVEADFQELMSCNCSICVKKGHLLSFVAAEQFTLEKGENHLSDYQFHKKSIHHLFCKNCGVSSFARGKSPDGKTMIAINARCLDNIDLGKFTVRTVDGKNF